MTELKKTAIGLHKRIRDDSLSLVAAGVAFYIFLSIFPAMASAISIYGLIADPQTIQSHISSLGNVVPADVMDILSQRMEVLARQENSSHALGLVIGILVSLWSANKAMKALSEALGIAYDAEERRGFIKLNIITLGLTLLSIVAFIVAVSAVVVVPIVVSVFLSNQPAEIMATALSWSVYLLVLIGMCLVLYNFGPDRTKQDWKELMPGAIVTAFLFVLASLAFAFYVANFGKYNEEYGALGAVVVTLLWMYIGAFIFLFGAEINAERIRHYVDREQGERGRLARAAA